MAQQQPIDNKQKLINEDGTPTTYFIRLLQDRGIFTTDIGQIVQELEGRLDDLGVDDLVDVDIVSTPPTDGQALTWDNALQQWVPGAGGGGGGGGVPITFAHFRDEKPNGTPGGGNIFGWQTRTLNTTVVNTVAGSSLAANQITLGPGTYNIRAVAPVYRTDRTKIRLRNITDGVTALNGTDDYAAFGQAGSTVAQLQGFLTLTSSKIFELQQYIDAGDGTYGLGVDVTGSGEPEVYSEVFIQQIGGVTYAGGGLLSTELTPLPPFQNGWVNYNAGYLPLTVVKTGRIVTINGLVKDGPSGTVVFTLPAGWRPALTVSGVSNSGGAYGTVQILANGEVYIYGSSVYTYFAFSFIVPEVDAYNGGPGLVAVDSGVVFPASPSLYQRFTRVDRGIEYFWDGTYWLSTEIYRQQFPLYNDLTNATIGGSRDYFYARPFVNQYDIYALEVTSYIFKTGGGWTVNFFRENPVSVAQNIATHNYGPNFTHTSQTTVNMVFSNTFVACGMAVNNFGVVDAALTYRLIG